MIYLNAKDAADGTTYKVSFKESSNVERTWEDWDDFLFRFPREPIDKMTLEMDSDSVPNDVLKRWNLVLEYQHAEQVQDKIFADKILEILKGNSFVDEVLEALPSFITRAVFTHYEFECWYLHGSEVDLESSYKKVRIVDPIMGWYCEPDEPKIEAVCDKFGNWKKGVAKKI